MNLLGSKSHRGFLAVVNVSLVTRRRHVVVWENQIEKLHNYGTTMPYNTILHKKAHSDGRK